MEKEETKITRDIIHWIKASGGDAWHVHGHPMQRIGEPDIDGWLPPLKEGGPHRHLKIEVKTVKGYPSTIQLRRILEYKRAGYISGIVTSVGEAEKLCSV